MSLAVRAVVTIAPALVAFALPAGAEMTTPWDPLTAEPDASWIHPNKVRMYAANSSAEYYTAFSTCKNNGGARGVNSLRFFERDAAHHVTSDLAGSFTVLTSGSEDFTDLLVLVAIDAPALPEGFSFSLGGYDLDPVTDFCHYDEPDCAAGRPSGYYGQTDPTAEPIAYDFESGMVTIVAFSGLSFDADHPVTVPYAFEDLPGRAVFSVYALNRGGTEIYHTNRGLEDLNDAGRGVSTFEVLPEPGAAALLACGMLTCLRRRRR